MSEVEISIDLTASKKVFIRKYRGQVLVDIRELYTADDGTMKPSKKGVSLTIDNWNMVKKLIPSIDKAIEVVKSKKK